MKRIIICLFTVILLLSCGIAFAKSSAAKVQISAVLDENGDLSVFETWNVSYREFSNLDRKIEFIRYIDWMSREKGEDSFQLSVMVDGRECEVTPDIDSAERSGYYLNTKEFAYREQFDAPPRERDLVITFDYTIENAVINLNIEEPTQVPELSLNFFTSSIRDIAEANIEFTIPEKAVLIDTLIDGKPYTLTGEGNVFTCSQQDIYPYRSSWPSPPMPSGFQMRLQPYAFKDSTVDCCRKIERDLSLDSDGGLQVTETYDIECFNKPNTGRLYAIYGPKDANDITLLIDGNAAPFAFESTTGRVTPDMPADALTGNHTYALSYTGTLPYRESESNHKGLRFGIPLNHDQTPCDQIAVRLNVPDGAYYYGPVRIDDFTSDYSDNTFRYISQKVVGAASTGLCLTSDAFSFGPKFRKNSVSADVILNSDGSLRVEETWDITIRDTEITGKDFDRKLAYTKKGTPGYYEVTHVESYLNGDPDIRGRYSGSSLSRLSWDDPELKLTSSDTQIKFVYNVQYAVKRVGDKAILNLKLFDSEDTMPAKIIMRGPGGRTELLTLEGPAGELVLNYDPDPGLFAGKTLYRITEDALSAPDADELKKADSISVTARIHEDGTALVETLVTLEQGTVSGMTYHLPEQYSDFGITCEFEDVSINGISCTEVTDYTHQGYTYRCSSWGDEIEICGVSRGPVEFKITYTLRDAVQTYNDKPYLDYDFLNARGNNADLYTLEILYPEGSFSKVLYDGCKSAQVKETGKAGIKRQFSELKPGNDAYRMLIEFKPEAFKGLKVFPEKFDLDKEKRYHMTRDEAMWRESRISTITAWVITLLIVGVLTALCIISPTFRVSFFKFILRVLIVAILRRDGDSYDSDSSSSSSSGSRGGFGGGSGGGGGGFGGGAGRGRH